MLSDRSLSAAVGRAIGELDRARVPSISASTVADHVIASHPAWQADRERVRQIADDKLSAKYGRIGLRRVRRPRSPEGSAA